MPVRHTQAIHGSTTDTGVAARIDSLAVVEVAFTVTNGLTGTDLRTRAISFMVPMPNVGTKKVDELRRYSDSGDGGLTRHLGASTTPPRRPTPSWC